METLYSRIVALSTHQDADLSQLRNTIKPEIDALKSRGADWVPLLQQLSGEQHSVALAHVFGGVLSAAALNGEGGSLLLDAFERFCGSMDGAEVRKYALDPFVTAVRTFSRWCVDKGTPFCLRGCYALRQAIDRFRATPESLTPLHSEFVLLCIKGHHHGYATELLDEPVLDVNPKLTGTTVLDYLSYMYYGGLAYIGVKRFKKAQQCLQLAIACPAQALSAIQVDAWKKLQLVSLIHSGDSADLPKGTSQVVARGLKSLPANQQLNDVASAFKSGDANKLQRAVSDRAALLSLDGNMGLAKQAMDAQKKRKVQKLTLTYTSLPLEDLKTRAKLGGTRHDAVAFLLDMTNKGLISAQIDLQHDNVSFSETGPASSGADQQSRLASELSGRMRAVVCMAERLQAVDNELAVSEDLNKKLKAKADGTDVSAGIPVGSSMDRMYAVGGGMGGYGGFDFDGALD